MSLDQATLYSQARCFPIIDQLNPEQREATCAIEGPVLIFAGAGSGKTRTLTHRIAYMIEHCGIGPEQILAVTFTNKAAEEMKERIRLLLGDQAQKLWAGTFHWFCSRTLRAEGQAIGVPPNFTIYDEADQLTLVKQAFSVLNLSQEETKPPAVLNEISQAKNQLLTVSEYKPRRNNPLEQAARKVYRVYQEELKRNRALDFDDLLMEAVRLLESQPEVRDKYQQRFPYLLVDEYQDINYAQFRLLQLLAGEQGNLCVVGDDDQSIYGWRGAEVGLILAFEEHFPQAQIFRLEQNYRSTQKILDCANAIISRNQDRAPKRLWTENPAGEDVIVYVAVNEEEEAEWVVDTMRCLVDTGEAIWGNFAVLYRINAMSRVMEEALMNFSIPYDIVGGVRFFERAEIKNLIAYLQVIHNPDDSVALRRIINSPPRGIGAQTLAVLDRLAYQGQLPLYQALEAALQDEDLQLRTRDALQDFHDLVEGLLSAQKKFALPRLVREMVKRSGYLERLQQSARADDARRAENVEEFVSTAARFARKHGEEVTLTHFLEYLALSSDIDQAEDLGTAVCLLTLHSAKGLEFPYVFIVGLEEGLLPHYRSQEEETDLAEECRLLYVGMTRAQRRLWLSRAQRRMQFGESRQNQPARFLDNLPREGVRRMGRAASRAPRLIEATAEEPEMAMTGRPLDLTKILSRAQISSPAISTRHQAEPVQKPDAPKWAAGDKVSHPKFGQGIVVSVTEEKDTHKIVVAFPDKGIKHLDLRYANLKKR